jgi:hypothetical protein
MSAPRQLASERRGISEVASGESGAAGREATAFWNDPSATTQRDEPDRGVGTAQALLEEETPREVGSSQSVARSTAPGARAVAGARPNGAELSPGDFGQDLPRSRFSGDLAQPGDSRGVDVTRALGPRLGSWSAPLTVTTGNTSDGTN